MGCSQNARFTLEASPESAADARAGQPLAQKLRDRVQSLGSATPVDLWRDTGWSFVVDVDAQRVEVVLASSSPNEWFLQVAPATVPGFIGRTFGAKPSAEPDRVQQVAESVHRAFVRSGASDVRWCWDGDPDENPNAETPPCPDAQAT